MNRHTKQGGQVSEGKRVMRAVRLHFLAKGDTYTHWARRHGYSPQLVSYAIYRPSVRGRLVSRIRAELSAETGLDASTFFGRKAS